MRTMPQQPVSGHNSVICQEWFAFHKLMFHSFTFCYSPNIDVHVLYVKLFNLTHETGSCCESLWICSIFSLMIGRQKEQTRFILIIFLSENVILCSVLTLEIILFASLTKSLEHTSKWNTLSQLFTQADRS